MPTTPDAVQNELTRSIHDASEGLHLRYEGVQGLQGVLARARRPRRWKVATPLAIGITVAVLGIGGIAVAHQPTPDYTTTEFKDLHPRKTDVTNASPEPHVLVAKIVLAGGTEVRLYVTAVRGNYSCVDVQQISQKGRPIGSVGLCREGAQASAQFVNGAVVGYMPAPDAVIVRVTGPSRSVEATVLNHYFLLSPEIAPAGSALVVRAYDEHGNQNSVVTMTVTKN
jgi:hypothetical protein